MYKTVKKLKLRKVCESDRKITNFFIMKMKRKTQELLREPKILYYKRKKNNTSRSQKTKYEIYNERKIITFNHF